MATANSSNASAPSFGYEYYLDYLDLLPVDEKQLRAHKCESWPGGSGRAGAPTALSTHRTAHGWPDPAALGGISERGQCLSSS